MKKQRNIKAFVISTKGILGKGRFLEHIKNSVEDEKIDKRDAERIFESVKEQLK